MAIYRGVGGASSTTSAANVEEVLEASVDAVAAAAAAKVSETNAAASAASAANTYDDFDDRYLGAKAADPTTDNDGDGLVAGALYFSTTLNDMRAYNGSSWKSIGVPVSGVESKTLTSGQTAVVFTNDIDFASFFISGSNADNGMLVKDVDYTVDLDTNTVTLTDSYPAGTLLNASFYTGTEDARAVIKRTTFTGDGSTVAFVAPWEILTGGANLVISVAGIIQAADTYTALGSTITFTEAPLLDAAIDVIHIEYSTLLAATASTTTYKYPDTNAVETTVQAKLSETVSVTDFGAVGDGVTDDTAAIQAAIDAVPATGGGVHFPEGNYLVTSSIVVKPFLLLSGDNTTITVSSGVNAFVRSTDGFPGQVTFKHLKFIGTSDTGRAIYITNNMPFIVIQNCYFLNFDTAIELSGSFCSSIEDCYIVSCDVGIKLLNACHSTVITNLFADQNRIGVAINGTNAGNEGNAVHNITLDNCALQKGDYGLWAESCLELKVDNMYHEVNAIADMQLGVADSGTYARAIYSSEVNGWQSSSPCASGTNIIVEHAVGLSLKGLAWNSGCSTTAALLTSDGFTDDLKIDYHRFTTVTPTATVPFTLSGDSAKRTVVVNGGKPLYPRYMEAITFGTVSSQPAKIQYENSLSGRPALKMESVGTSHDIVLKAQDWVHVFNSSEAKKFSVNVSSSYVETEIEVLPSIAQDGALNLGNGARRWNTVYAATGTINTSDAREKTFLTIEDAEKAAALEIKANLRKFKFNDAIALKGDNARIHFGASAQQVGEILESHGLVASEYAFYCYDEWEAELDEKGNEVTPAGNRYGIRYEELLAFILAAL